MMPIATSTFNPQFWARSPQVTPAPELRRCG
jgi:hypothetical protein